MSDFNEGTILLDFRDAKRAPIKDEVTLTFDNFHLKQLNFRATVQQFPAVLPAVAFPNGIWQVFIQPTHYRPKSIFISVPAGDQVIAQEDFLLDANQAKPVFPTPATLFSEPVWQALAELLNRSTVNGQTGIALYTQLTKKEPLRAAGLLNLHARSQFVTLLNQQSVFGGFEQLTDIRQDRVFATLEDDFYSEVKRAARPTVKPKIFNPANGTLHTFPPGFSLLKKEASFKTPEAVGNLQLTFAQDTEKALMVDADVDEAQGIKHAFEVLGHIFTGGKTHPYDIHQILTYFFPNLQLGYDLVPK